MYGEDIASLFLDMIDKCNSKRGAINYYLKLFWVLGYDESNADFEDDLKES